MALRPWSAPTALSRSLVCSTVLGFALAFASCAQPESGTEGSGGSGGNQTGEGGGSGGDNATGGAAHAVDGRHCGADCDHRDFLDARDA